MRYQWTKDQCFKALLCIRYEGCLYERWSSWCDGRIAMNEGRTHARTNALPTNSSSSSSSSPFSESICMASSMKLTAFPARAAELRSLPNAPPRLSFSLRRVKYCSANSSRSPGWFLRTSTVKLCRSSVKPSGISILISWRWNVRKIRPDLARNVTAVGPVSPRQLRRMIRKRVRGNATDFSLFHHLRLFPFVSERVL